MSPMSRVYYGWHLLGTAAACFVWKRGAVRIYENA